LPSLRGYPGYQSAPALNPAKGCTPCAQGCAGDSAREPMEQSEEVLENPRVNHLPIPKALNRCGGVAGMPRGFGETLGRVGEADSPGCPRYSSDWDIGPTAEPSDQALRIRRETLCRVERYALETQGSLASSATFSPARRTLLFPSASSLGWIIKRLRRNSHVSRQSSRQILWPIGRDNALQNNSAFGRNYQKRPG